MHAGTAIGDGETAADRGTAERDSDSDDEPPEDTPRQRAAAELWDASYSEASCRVMVQHGLLDMCAALLRHSQATGDGELSGATLPDDSCLRRGRMLEAAFDVRTLLRLRCSQCLLPTLIIHALAGSNRFYQPCPQFTLLG